MSLYYRFLIISAKPERSYTCVSTFKIIISAKKYTQSSVILQIRPIIMEKYTEIGSNLAKANVNR